jgi:hypothetical protein
MASLVNFNELTGPTDDEVRIYVYKTLCDNSCLYGLPAVCMASGVCNVFEKYKTGELSFRKTKEGEIVRLF